MLKAPTGLRKPTSPHHLAVAIKKHLYQKAAHIPAGPQITTALNAASAAMHHKAIVKVLPRAISLIAAAHRVATAKVAALSANQA